MIGRNRRLRHVACAVLAGVILLEPTEPVQAQWFPPSWSDPPPRRRARRPRPVQPPPQPVEPVKPPAPPVRVEPDDRPYDNKLLRLSEILGAIHYLRELCGANEGQLWREQMQSIVKSEGSTAIRRAKLVNEFNRGYRGYRRTYRSCTKSAKTAIERFLEEGEQISKAMLAENR